ncbi:osmosensor protein [Arthroderma uncinatum]|uniref:osmosensor protein n=1 Tax=Arthroderma uncinatum TaxID=74035 RepID=UPI00144AF0A2|nr:osmosensor protein [Arthroderma uncinatum]KAF3480090.1 osmosensor protein [Arthroderma uncinatum]
MARFQMSNLVGDPFALATVSIAMLAWIIGFVSCIIADIKTDIPNFFWWTVAFQFCIVTGIAAVMGSNTAHIYSTAIVGYAAAGLVSTTFVVDGLLTSKEGAKQSGGAGLILLAMTDIVWIFYFGSTPQSRPRNYIDSFAPHKEQPNYRSSKPISHSYTPRPETTLSSSHQPQLYTSAQLNGFETSSPMTGYNPTTASATGIQPMLGSQTNPSTVGGETSNEVGQPTEYPYRAKAIYSYEANPDDANEISFTKHEILEVSDVSGRWWQAKKSTGETGIAPSNYLILL